jgi:SAM-dependent methyltransferase
MKGRPKAMAPYGLALLDCFQGNSEARVIVRRDDDLEVPLPARHFFRSPTEFSAIEVAALGLCQGHVLDIGAGTGLHSLALVSQGRPVTAVDISPEAVEIMVQRGVPDVHCFDIFDFEGGPFDTLLMLGHGIGIVEDLEGLSRLLHHARQLTRGGGQLLLDSQDVRQTDDPRHLAYHDANRRAKRYIGETRLRFEYKGQTGPYCGWLHVDLQTLRDHAHAAGWNCARVLEGEGGDYLARLTPR